MEEKNTTMGTTETMEDYKEALEASYRRIRPGDIVTGTVIDVNDQDVTIDFNYYAPGRIPVTELSDDPTYHVLENVAVGDTLTATVVVPEICFFHVRMQLRSWHGINCRKHRKQRRFTM